MHDWLVIVNSTSAFSDFATRLGYAGIFLWFISFDQFTPVPEEITLLTIGYLSAIGIFNPVLAGAVALIAFLAVDTGYYFLSRSGNSFFRKIYKKVNPSRMNKFREKLKLHLPRTLIFLCFIPRMRTFGPIAAGMTNIPFRKFLLYDAIGLIIFTGIYIFVGAVFHSSLKQLSEITNFRHIIFLSAMVVLGAVILIFLPRNSNSKKETPENA